MNWRDAEWTFTRINHICCDKCRMIHWSISISSRPEVGEYTSSEEYTSRAHRTKLALIVYSRSIRPPLIKSLESVWQFQSVKRWIMNIPDKRSKVAINDANENCLRILINNYEKFLFWNPISWFEIRVNELQTSTSFFLTIIPSIQGQLVNQNVSWGVIISTRSLVLQRVARLHAGNYGCAAANDRGENQSAFVNLRIHCKYHPNYYSKTL